MGYMETQAWKTLLEGLDLSSRRGKASKGTIRQYQIVVGQFLDFVNSEEELDHEIALDELVSEGLENSKRAMARINSFFHWLQGEEVRGYKPFIYKRGKRKGEPKKVDVNTAINKAYGNVRGLYSHNGVDFGRWRTPKLGESKAVINDTSHQVFKFDEKQKEIYADMELLQQLAANLGLRDQAIMFSILSTSQDPGDLLALDVAFVTQQKGRKRLFWAGKRAKTGEPFKTFFSREATQYVKRYLQQEREDADPGDPLFITKKIGKTQNRLEPQHVSGAFRYASEKMGLINKDTQNTLRPKRLRHLFRTACDRSGIEEGYINVFMGHATTLSQKYLEKPPSILESQYALVEPFITVFKGESHQELSEVQRQINRLNETILELQEERIETKRRIMELEARARSPFEEELLKALEDPEVRGSFLKWLRRLAEEKPH